MPNFISKVNNDYNNYYFDKITNEIKIIMPEIIIDRSKLEKWVNMCVRLENIDKETRDELGFKMKLAEKDQQLNKLRTRINELEGAIRQLLTALKAEADNNGDSN